MNIKMTGRGRRLVVIRNKQGFPKLLKNGGHYEHHLENPPHGFRTRDCVRIDKHEFGTRQRVGVLKTVRWDGRYEVEFRNGTKRNVMVSKLELIHHGCGARYDETSRPPRTRWVTRPSNLCSANASHPVRGN